VHGRLEGLGALQALGTTGALQPLGTTSPELAQSVPKTVTATDAAVDDRLSSCLYLPHVLDRNQVPLAVSLYVYMDVSVCIHACLSVYEASIHTCRAICAGASVFGLCLGCVWVVFGLCAGCVRVKNVHVRLHRGVAALKQVWLDVCECLDVHRALPFFSFNVHASSRRV